MSLALSIGAEDFRVVATPNILDAVAQRYSSFVTTGASNSARVPINIRVGDSGSRFAPTYERPAEVSASESMVEKIVIAGEARGYYSIPKRRGVIEDVTGIGAIDALIRIALSVVLPLDGALLMHGAALRNGHNGGLALCGSSGSGKSTAAKAMGGLCDEFVVLRRAANDMELHSTPYWSGRPYSSHCEGIVCLERGGKPGYQNLSRVAAVRALARHVIRYVAVERIDRLIFDLLCSISVRVVVSEASCPEGDEFIPFLERHVCFANAA